MLLLSRIDGRFVPSLHVGSLMNKHVLGLRSRRAGAIQHEVTKRIQQSGTSVRLDPRSKLGSRSDYLVLGLSRPGKRTRRARFGKSNNLIMYPLQYMRILHNSHSPLRFLLSPTELSICTRVELFARLSASIAKSTFLVCETQPLFIYKSRADLGNLAICKAIDHPCT